MSTSPLVYSLYRHSECKCTLADEIITIARYMENYPLFGGVDSALDFTRATNRYFTSAHHRIT
jgi:hypothetical protein